LSILWNYRRSARWRYRWHAFHRVHAQTRSLLAVLCLAVGIVTLIQVLALGAGTEARMEELLSDSGTRTLTISPGNVAALPNRGGGIALAETLTLDDYRLLAREAAPAVSLVAVSTGARIVEYRELSVAATVTGTQPAYFALRRYVAASGRLLDDADEAALARVVVLGAHAAEQLFGASQEVVLAANAALGQTILIGRMPFEVVGILAARGNSMAGIAQDDGIYVPISTALRRLFNADYLNNILIDAGGVAALPALRTRVDGVLRTSHRLEPGTDPDYLMLDATRALAATARGQDFANLFFRGFALLTLGMAGAGIFAVNHLNIRERAAEFGLRRAVGARRGDIAGLVLGETLLLGLAGGLLGIVTGFAVLAGLRAVTDWALAADPQIVTQALGAALILSMLAAVLPAWGAAARNPLAALNRI
jgi:putative ABC transport system permease protein